MVIIQLVSIVQAKLSIWWALSRDQARVRARFQEKIASGEILDGQLPKRSFMEQQGKMLAYCIEDQIQDFLDLMISLGYTVLFCAAAPKVAFISLLYFCWRLRTDSWRFATVLRRPFPSKASGIHAWNTVQSTLTWVGLLTSVAVPLWNMKEAESLKPTEKFLLFFVLEHVAIALKVIVSHYIPQIASATRLMITRREYVVKDINMGKVHIDQWDSSLELPPALRSAAQPLDQQHPEWPLVDNDDNRHEVLRRSAVPDGMDRYLFL